MGTHKGFTTIPAKMTRDELQTLVLGFVDHRLAVVEERVAELERAIHSSLLPSCGITDGGQDGQRTNNESPSIREGAD
jgi:hypothetical protein